MSFEFLKNVVGTCLAFSLSNYISAAQSQPQPQPQPPPRIGDRVARIIERNPRMIVDPVISGTGAIYGRLFTRSNEISSHPIPVDSEGRDNGPQARQLIKSVSNSTSAEKILNIFGYTSIIITCGVTLTYLITTKNAPLMNNTSLMNNDALTTNTVTPNITPPEVLSASDILAKATTIASKQIMIYIPIIAAGITITIIIYYAYERYSKAQLKKEELILRNLQRINTKLNLLPDNKE